MSTTRRQKIDEILSYLEKQATHVHPYPGAVNENITFYKSAYSLIAFYKWLHKIAPTIKKDDLQELMDIDSESPYDTELISSLAKTERSFFPGLINPLIKRIYQFVSAGNCRIIASLGSGAMETEKQLIKKLIKSGNNKQLVFVGIDKSQRARAFARENLSEIPDVAIIEKNELDDDSLNTILTEQDNLYTVILCNNDIFSLNNYFTKTKFDLAFTSFFKHHFSPGESENIDTILKNISKIFIEYDGVNNGFNKFIQSLFVFKNPVLLSGTVFSNLRYLKKKDLLAKKGDAAINTYWMKGTYLKETIINNHKLISDE